MQTFAYYLQQTMQADATQRREGNTLIVLLLAEAFLFETAAQPGFGKLVLAFIKVRRSFLQTADSLKVLRLKGAPVDAHTRSSAIIFFKNFIKRRWVVTDDANLIPDGDREAIRDQIVGLMLTAPKAFKKQLGECLEVMASSDFPERWPHLLEVPTSLSS
jgi:hypothetical protein